MSGTLLSVRELHAGYGSVPVLRGVSLDVRPGSVTALVGANGAGKTTLLRTVAGLQQVARGELRLEGREMAGWSSSRRVEAGVVLVPEGRWIFPDFTVEENLKVGAYASRARAAAADRLKEVYDLFPRLRERRKQKGGSLSGGEQQMLALGRGLMSCPRLLLLDEPTLGLAPLLARHLFETIGVIRDGGVTVLLSEQDVRSTLSLADYAYVLENGRLALEGPGPALLDDAQVRQAYLAV
ncbi:MAG: ABC transporter ATP-binding protein [Deltaproteobacteria bacterium]|nr:ABC transporter ATP-binding protein [Deltaproteobacteria bacterium]